MRARNKTSTEAHAINSHLATRMVRKELLGGHSGQTCRPHTQISVYGSMRRSMIDLFSSFLPNGILRCGQYQDADQEEEEQKPLGHRQGSKHTI